MYASSSSCFWPISLQRVQHPASTTVRYSLASMSLDHIVRRIQLISSASSVEEHKAELEKLYQELEEKVRTHKRLASPRRYQFETLHEDIREEGLQRLFLYLLDSANGWLGRFDPEKGSFIQWVNFLLRNRFYPEATRHLTLPMKVGRTIPKMLHQRLDIDDVQFLPDETSENPSLLERVKECLISDPDGTYKNTYIENHPRANFRRLSIARLEGLSWDELADELEVKASTLRSFYTRTLAKLAMKLKECATD